MSEFTIAWLDEVPDTEVEFAQELLPGGFRISRDGISEADALMTQHAPVDADLLRTAERAGLIQKYGRREDGIDLDAAAETGKTVAVMPLRGCIAVAEHAMTLVLSLSKQLVTAHRTTAAGAYRELGL